jgi:DNA invertase Pin-like site-specific DNA recombinase
MTKQDEIQADRELILALGGTSYIAKKLQISKQRVHNWLTRGIPASIKLRNPRLFLRKK